MSLKELIRSDISEVFLNTDDFASECLYESNQVSLIVNQHILPRTRRNDFLDGEHVVAHGADFLGALADLLNGDPDYIPKAGEEITWTSEDNQPRKFIVFPRIAGRCFDYADPERVMVRIYGIDSEDLRSIKVVGLEGKYWALVGTIRQETTPVIQGTTEKWVLRDICRAAIICPAEKISNKSRLEVTKGTETVEPNEIFHVNQVASTFDNLTVVELWRDSIAKIQARGTEGN